MARGATPRDNTASQSVASRRVVVDHVLPALLEGLVKENAYLEALDDMALAIWSTPEGKVCTYDPRAALGFIDPSKAKRSKVRVTLAWWHSPPRARVGTPSPCDCFGGVALMQKKPSTKLHESYDEWAKRTQAEINAKRAQRPRAC